jgi:hypothetical protein
MFSVKWIYQQNGLEVNRIFEAERVATAFRNDGPPDSPRRQFNPTLFGREVERALVILGDGDLDDISIDCGKVYVMNQAGRTVASYDLGDPCATPALGQSMPTPLAA